MNKSYYSLGLMSGTSADGIDASIIQSNGDNECEVILDKYFKYTQNIYENIHKLKDKINDSLSIGRYYGALEDRTLRVVHNEKVLHPFQPYSSEATKNQINFFDKVFTALTKFGFFAYHIINSCSSWFCVIYLPKTLASISAVGKKAKT